MLCQLSYRGETEAKLSLAWCYLEQFKGKSLHRYGCCSLGLGTSNPSLAVAEGFPCSVAGLMAVPLSLVSHETRAYAQVPLATTALNGNDRQRVKLKR